MSIDGEIGDQPRTITRAVAAAGRSAEAVAALVQAAAERPLGLTHILIAARGTSDNAARHAQYVWGHHLRMPVALTTPSLFAGPHPPRLRGCLVLGISQSGASPDLVGVLRAAHDARQPTVAVTNHPESPLAEQADVVIAMDVGREHAVAATKTYTAQLACLDAMTDALATGLDLPAPGLTGQLALVPDAVQRVLEEDLATPQVLRLLEGLDRCAVVGRGLDMATVGEWALKLQELSGVLAHAWSTADFRHGPFALAAGGLPVLLVSTDPAHRAETVALAIDLVAAGAAPVLLGDAPPRDLPCPVVALPSSGPVAGAYTAAVAAQLATVALTRHRGGDPDRPDLISKVTLTR
ncbi:MAG TPA: SIS domain-containing protein [Euzebya sp.]|nr:SIS domain-containing protein [Euzebya sp.]